MFREKVLGKQVLTTKKVPDMLKEQLPSKYRVPEISIRTHIATDQ